MGNYLSLYKTTTDIDDIIKSISLDESYQNYQTKFDRLNPSKKVSIDSDSQVLIIEHHTNNNHLYSEYNFDWKNPCIKNKVLQTLDRIYNIYSSQNIYYSDKNIIKEHPAIDFVIASLLDGKDWDEWLDAYFYKNSEGYNMFKSMGEDYDNLEVYPPHAIWCRLISGAMETGQIYVSVISDIAEKLREICNRYEDIVEIVNNEGLSLAYVALIDGRWWYIGIDLKCLEKIDEFYQEQFTN